MADFSVQKRQLSPTAAEANPVAGIADRVAGGLPAEDRKQHHPERIKHLDGLRFLAFLAVFLHHSLHAPMLWIGVDVFFVLSGYLITGILLRTKGDPGYFSVFYKRRTLRIFPPYYILLFVVFVFVEKQVNGGVVTVYASYLSNFNDAYKVVLPRVASLSSMWSLAVEEQFYLLWPLLVWMLSSRGLMRLSLAMVLVAPVLRVAAGVYSGAHWQTYYLLPCRMDLLALGAVIAIYQAKVSREQFFRASAYGMALAFCCISTFILLAVSDNGFRTGANSPLFNCIGYTLVALSAFGFLSWLIPRSNSLIGRWLGIAPMTYLGGISYVLYLAHELVINEVEKFAFQPFVSAAASLVIVIAIAAFSWHFIEAPIQRFKSAWAPYKTTAPTEA